MIAYQGHEGAYSHLACKKVFPDKTTMACETFIDAMRAVEQGAASLAMIPVENSTAGRVEEIYRLIPKMKLHIVGEHYEPVNHCLLAPPGSTIDKIKTVASHPQALAQCAGNIEQLNLRPLAKLDTAGAAKEVAQLADTSKAAIASSLAATLYSLTTLQDNFQDITGNTTRFIVLSHGQSLPEILPGKEYITSIIFKVRNIPAALYKALGGFATNNINLLKLESYMPHGTLSASQFHVDIQAHPGEKRVQFALEELGFFAEDIRLLGTYLAHPFRKTIAF